MPMYFNGELPLENFLFSGLTANAWEGLTGLCIGVLSLSVLYEIMRYFELGFTDGTRLCTDEPSSEGSTDVPVSERRPLLILGYFRRMSK
ncbi:unnamed protein product [Notodromas monacha]|uniref:Copper transport protein n=1 Tax=Notodromas monacha TaxID=399045 RepID=A0A7R9BJ72_9CRUS|nr:unnamed protein product [Notodromas monacha]CAG0915125.1 unnamed protein product [Notodromas monacha]